jgi:Glu-tRNA(Gln) amidotransferase subunit E-like FAD-binding protein
MLAKPIEGSDTPYIQPGDENSRFYTKPDVPPIPHPAEVLERLQAEFPDKAIEELVKMADAEVSAEIAKRSAENPMQVEFVDGEGNVVPQ